MSVTLIRHHPAARSLADLRTAVAAMRAQEPSYQPTWTIALAEAYFTLTYTKELPPPPDPRSFAITSLRLSGEPKAGGDEVNRIYQSVQQLARTSLPLSPELSFKLGVVLTNPESGARCNFYLDFPLDPSQAGNFELSFLNFDRAAIVRFLRAFLPSASLVENQTSISVESAWGRGEIDCERDDYQHGKIGPDCPRLPDAVSPFLPVEWAPKPGYFWAVDYQIVLASGTPEQYAEAWDFVRSHIGRCHQVEASLDFKLRDVDGLELVQSRLKGKKSLLVELGQFSWGKNEYAELVVRVSREGYHLELHCKVENDARQAEIERILGLKFTTTRSR